MSEKKVITGDAALTSGGTENITAEDESLFRPKDGELIKLTPERLQKLMDSMQARMKDIDARYPRLVEDCPYETKLAVTAWVFDKLVQHAKEGGSFRYLIYNRLGFGHDAYLPLCDAGGLVISNEFVLGPEEALTKSQADPNPRPQEPEQPIPFPIPDNGEDDGDDEEGEDENNVQ